MIASFEIKYKHISFGIIFSLFSDFATIFCFLSRRYPQHFVFLFQLSICWGGSEDTPQGNFGGNWLLILIFRENNEKYNYNCREIMEGIAEFMAFGRKIKKLKRAGWLRYIHPSDAESVADHSFGVALHFLALSDENLVVNGKIADRNRLVSNMSSSSLMNTYVQCRILIFSCSFRCQ